MVVEEGVGTSSSHASGERPFPVSGGFDSRGGNQPCLITRANARGAYSKLFAFLQVGICVVIFVRLVT